MNSLLLLSKIEITNEKYILTQSFRCGFKLFRFQIEIWFEFNLITVTSMAAMSVYRNQIKLTKHKS